MLHADVLRDALSVRVGGGPAVVEIDDDQRFRRPLLRLRLEPTDHRRLGAAQGLTPGVRYWVRMDGGPPVRSFRLPRPRWPQPEATYAWARNGWNTVGRQWLWRFSGLRWDPTTKRWTVDDAWPHAPGLVGSRTYFTEHTTSVAVDMARACEDLDLVDELAAYFIAYSDRMTTLGAMHTGALGTGDRSLLQPGPTHYRTFPWIEHIRGRPRIRECELCNAQAFHPAARLMRLISTLPPKSRTGPMLRFSALYSQILLREHVVRHLFTSRYSVCGETLPPIEGWQRQLDDPSCRALFTDREMWLVATAAELLGANANDPSAMYMRRDERAELLRALGLATELLRSRISIHTLTRAADGTNVGSATWFDGDYAKLDDFAHVRWSGPEYPERRAPKPDIGWDVAHAHRIPAFLRSMFDNRAATRLDFPSHRDLELVANQLRYRVFYGDFERPLLRNFFDGTDGWYRVGYHGRGFGYPPAHFCDQRDRNRPCMNPFAFLHWGSIAFAATALDPLLEAVVGLASSEEPELVEFRDRYFFYRPTTFSWLDDHGAPQVPIALWWLVAGSPERLAGCIEGDA